MNVNKSLQESIYNALRERIINIELVPGSTISVYEIANQMNVSRTPVREAFLRLAEESLLTIHPKKKSIVSLIDLERVHQECFFRVALEQANYAQFIRVHQDRHLEQLAAIEAQLVRAIQQQDIARALDLDDDFHRLPFEVTGQMLCSREISLMNGHYHRARSLILRIDTFNQKMHESHLQLIEYFRKGDLAMAQAVLASHCEIPSVQRVFPEYFTRESMHYSRHSRLCDPVSGRESGDRREAGQGIIASALTPLAE